jgi:hypothetical protein
MRETVWSISGVSVRVLRGALARTRGLRAVSQVGNPPQDEYSPLGRGKTSRLIGLRCTISNDFSRDVLKTD